MNFLVTHLSLFVLIVFVAAEKKSLSTISFTPSEDPKPVDSVPVNSAHVDTPMSPVLPVASSTGEIGDMCMSEDVIL